jgi:hypothetical protein
VIDFETVRALAREIGGIEEGTMYGVPAVKVRGKLLACIPSNRSAEPGSLVLRVGFEERAALLAEAPEVYYVTPHYEGYTAVLVRFSRIDVNGLRDLLLMARRFVSGKEGHAALRRHDPAGD